MLASAVISIVLVAATGPATAPAKGDDATVSKLIESLSNADSTVRETATKQLEEMGAPARPALVKAIRSNNPEQRSRAAAVLMKLPWYASGDAPEVRRYLSEYGKLEVERRKVLVVDMYRKQRGRAIDALLRLLSEEPSDEVRWQIVALLSREDEEEFYRKLRGMDLGADDPPVLRLAAQAWYYLDKPKALELCRRALEADARNPSSDSALRINDPARRRPEVFERQLDFCAEVLIADAVGEKKFDEAAKWLRRQIPREPADERYALAKLTALHVYFGPLKGVEDDVKTWGAKGDQAPATQPVAAPALTREKVLAAMNLSADERLIAAYFLLESKFYDQAEQEAKAAADMPLLSDEARLGRDIRLNIIFGLLYGARDQDEAAADALAKAVSVAPGQLWRSEADLWSEIWWRRARAAAKKGDKALVDKHVESLKQYTPTGTDTAIEIVNWLKSSGREKDGKELFERVFLTTREQMDSNDPTSLNDLAWLCARCEERLNDGLELAQKAVAARPENAAYLDTLAEVNFRLGKREEAVKLESKALELRPGDEFMLKQLERFKSEKR
jgi:tetratricopeptide (TPR) repeat protein